MARTVNVDRFADQVAQALGPRLISFLLYGSLARGTHVPDRSDTNTLLICDAADDALFAAMAPAVRSWTGAGNPAPLIFTEQEWSASAHAFPIEYADAREAHRVLAGRDPWAGITVRREDLARQLEHELLGKLVRLRQAYVALGSQRKQLARVIAGSIGGFLAILRATLRLAGETPPPAADALVRAAGGLVGFPPERLTALVAQATGGPPLRLAPDDPLPGAYLVALARTAAFVNRFLEEGADRP
jgi:hypothetical protein